MKKLFSFLFLLVMGSLTANAQTGGSRLPLSGYFLVSCWEESLKSGCSLDIASIKVVDGDSMRCGDGVFYQNISSITYISSKELNLRYMDDFAYRVRLQGRQHTVYLSTNPLILRDAGPAAAALRRNPEVVKGIRQNRITADLLQAQVDSLHLDFVRKRQYEVLLYGTLSVVQLPDRQDPKSYTTPLGYHQYLLLQDKANKIRVARVLKSKF